MWRINPNIWLTMWIFLLAMACTASGEVIYVDDDASLGGNGQNWATPYRYLQDALTSAVSGDEIRVAEGIYKPDRGGGNAPGDRYTTFQLKNGVVITGGYAGFGEPDPDARDIEVYETVLSGDLLGNDGPDFANNGENSYHVVTGSGANQTAVLDGFTITGGNANGSLEDRYGGGMYNYEGSPTVTNCTFSGNSASAGGGMYNNVYSSPTLVNCTFSGNSAIGSGGGMRNYESSSPTLINCTFSGNSADGGGGMANAHSSRPTLTNCTFSTNSANSGGGMRNYKSSPTLTNCTFSGNSAYLGGGMYNHYGSPTLTNCMFSGNSASGSGGGMYNRMSQPTVTNCIFIGNSAGWNGGGMYNHNESSPTVTNCILWGNTAPSDPQIHNDGTSSATVSYSDVQGGWLGAGNINADPLFVDPAIGEYHLLPGSPCIDAGDNSAVPPSVVTDLDGNYRIANGTVDMGVYEFGSTPPQPTLFVDARATGAYDGSSWVDAFADLQEALTVATAFPQVDEIRVAQGAYKPAGYITPPPPPPFADSNSQEFAATPGDRTATFQLKNGVVIKGGYAGLGEPDPNARDIDTYETILSGDLAGNDEPNFVNYQENSYHVLNGSGCDETAVLDGFTITGGNANETYPSPHSCGGGMFNNSSSPTLVNCTFTGNSAVRDGGAMYNSEQSNPTLTDCTFTGNSAIYDGGAMCNRESSPTVTSCTFTDNSSNHGGGMSNWPGSPIVTNCTFSSNSAELGGAVFNWDSKPTLANCIFSSNSAREWGGAICNLNTSSPTLTNCTFNGNSAMAGGGVYNQESSPTLINCTFSGNSTTDVVFNENGGGMHNDNSHPKLTNCTFDRNSATDHGGGMFNYFSSKPTLINCSFIGNVAVRQDGGGMFNGSASHPTLTNCLFIGNIAKDGGGMRNWGSDPTLVNCTFSKNSASGNGGGVSTGVSWSKPKLTNCILWGNSDKDGVDESAQIYYGSPVVNYCCIQAWTGSLGGTGNIDTDPCFVQPESLTPISYWKFDEGNETTAYDSVGQNHGTVYGAQWMSGQVSSALDFDGMDDYVDIPYDSSLDINASDGITLSVWIKLNSYPDSLNQGPIFGLYDSEGAGTKHYLSIMKSIYGNVIAWDQWPPSGGSLNSIKPDLNTWYHIIVVEDSSYRAIYINGSLDVSDNTPESYEGNPPDTIRIGSRADDWAHFYFDGSIDEAAVYNTVLTPYEIRRHYYISLSGEGYPLMPDYHLLPGSPCINTGDQDYVAEPNETDFDGKPRVIAGRVDMGAYEFNHTPLTDAGSDQTVEAQAPWGATVTLDGSGSSDADSTPGTYDDIACFDWYKVDPCDPNADVFLGNARIIDCNLPFGRHIISLEVTDRAGDFDIDDVNIVVQDTTPPDFNLSVTPTILWPPNHEMVEITTSWTVSDKCDLSPDVSLVSIVANEGDDTIGDGHTSDDIQIDDDGSIYVRAERSGPGIGRIYTITYQAVDDFGNTSFGSAAVSVPHELKFLARMGYRWLWRNHTGILPEDLNGDGIVNLEDFAIFAAYWIQ